MNGIGPTELQFRLVGSGSGEEALQDFWHWLRDESIAGVTVDWIRPAAQAGTMGGTASAVAVVAKPAGAVTEVIRAAGRWIRLRKPDVEMEVSKGEITTKIVCRDAANFDAVIRRVIDILEAGSSDEAAGS
jgi:hypothetical protein